MTELPGEYADVRFTAETDESDWPEHFAIITAYATTGQTWTAEKNDAADAMLREELQRRGLRIRRITGYSPNTGHNEPGWAAELSLEDACALGLRFHQHAIFWVDGDELAVVLCNAPRTVFPMGSFRERYTAQTAKGRIAPRP